MRVPIGTTGLSTSGGSVELIGRRGEGWRRIASADLDLREAIALLEAGAEADPDRAQCVPADAAGAPRFESGEQILWQYRRHLETARVVRDDDRGLVVWIPSGSARLESTPADGRRTRDVPLEQRFSVPWVMTESTWAGPGVLRVAPAGRPWSVWFFRREDGAQAGAYVNLELPHRRRTAEAGSRGIVTHDLVLDLWLDADNPGAEDVWLKDADELTAAIDQGRFTSAQAEAVRALADAATQEFIASASWPLDEGWETWMPRPEDDASLALPEHPLVEEMRCRSGAGEKA